MTQEEEKTVFGKIRNNDEAAFKLIFNSYYSSLCHYALQFINDREHSEEVVQELFVKIWEKRETLNVEISLRHYLFRSVRNQCLNLLQHEKIRKLHAEKLKDALLSEDAPGDYFISQEMILKIEESVNSLPEKRREIFRLSREEGLKYREIAEKLHISIKTVEIQMGLALKSLREKLRVFVFFFFSQKK
jgi:RNA polymerase sigma-70 factor (ECF subfamily)